MMLKKTAAAFIAAAAAITPLSANTPLRTAPVVFAEETSTAAKLPSWIPDDFASALEFRNTYGATRIGDGLICIVFQQENSFNDDNDMPRYQIKTTDNVMDTLSHEVYSSDESKTKIEVVVYAPTVQGNIDIAIIDTWIKSGSLDLGYNHASAYYTFSVDESFNITETDIYSWLPDCRTEFDEYTEKNGSISVNDNYVVLCLTETAGTAYTWNETDSGADCFKLAGISLCSPVYADPPTGGAVNSVYAYKAVKDGYAKISFDFAKLWGNYEAEKSVTADCVVLDDAQTVMLPGDSRVSLLDNSNGQPIPVSADDGFALCEVVNPIEVIPIIAELDSNPCMLRGLKYPLDKGVHLKTPGTYSIPMVEGTCQTDENYMTVTRYDNGAYDAVFRLTKNEMLEPDTTRITLYDKDTGELIPSELLEHHPWRFGTDIRMKAPDDPDEWIYTGPVYSVESNPCIYNDDLARIYRDADEFKFLCEDQPEVTYYSNGSMDFVFRIKLTVSGDVNGDGRFGISDVILLQKWLLNASDTELAEWEEADFCMDNKLDVFDLCLMKRELLKKWNSTYIEPDNHIEYGTPLYVIEDGLTLYSGPDEQYDSVASIPKGTELDEMGYQNNTDRWIFTEFNGNYGWIRTLKEDNSTPTIYYMAEPDKPVIYLYPENETDVHVELELTESELHTTYPKYNNGWDVVAYPDGTLLNKADGSHHKYLFWDSVNCRTRFDFSKGFCVAGSDTEKFLKEKLTYMGLTEYEMNEFIVYWLPRMEHNAYNLISFQGDAYTDSAKLTITPAPDSECRIFMAYVPLENAVDIEPQQLDTFERKGFSVVEWGGCEIR